MFHSRWLIPYESYYVIYWFYYLLLVLLATCDLHSKHCNYDVTITLSFFYYVIITLSLRDKWMSHNMSRNMIYISYVSFYWLMRQKLCHLSHCDYDVMIFYSNFSNFDIMTHLSRVRHIITYAYNLIKEKDSGIIVNLRNRSWIHSKFAKSIVNSRNI